MVLSVATQFLLHIRMYIICTKCKRSFALCTTFDRPERLRIHLQSPLSLYYAKWKWNNRWCIFAYKLIERLSVLFAADSRWHCGLGCTSLGPLSVHDVPCESHFEVAHWSTPQFDGQQRFVFGLANSHRTYYVLIWHGLLMRSLMFTGICLRFLNQRF